MKKITISLVLLIMLCSMAWADSGEELVQAATECDLSEVERLLEAGSDVNAQNKYGNTGLRSAAHWGWAEIVELLIAKGADVNLHPVGGYTALCLAADNGHAEIVEMLIDAGADLDIRESYNGYAALIKAAEKGYTEIVELLVAAGAVE